MTNCRRRLRHSPPALFLSIALALAPARLVFAQTGIAAPLSPAADAMVLPDAPVPQQNNPPPPQPGSAIAAAAAAVQSIRPHNRVIEPGEVAPPLSAKQKAIFAMRESANPINLATSLYSAGYEQLTGSNPKYGSNGDAFASRFGASMAHTVSMRIFADGFFATVLRQDPRYYRVGEGNSLLSRSLRSAEQAVVRRSDNGDQQVNSSGLAGRAAAALLTLAYYPPASRKAGVVLSTFGVSVATDAGGDLVLEFFPDLVRKFPILKKIEIQ